MKFSEYIKSKKNNNCIISKGLNLNSNFWEDFLRLINNSGEISELLDVPKNKVSTWNSKVNKALTEYQKSKNVNKKSRIIKTGKFK